MPNTNQPDAQPISFNIFGACVSRDLFPKDTPYEIRQYVSFSSPMSVYKIKGDRTLTEEDLEGARVGSRFSRRCMMLDHNKTGLDYLFQRPSDWLILDFADLRMPLLKYGNNNYLTRTNLFLKNKAHFEKLFGEYETVPRVTPEEAVECVEWFGRQILKVYPPERIILNRYGMVEQYLSDDGTLVNYSYLPHIRRINAMLKKANDHFEEMCGHRCFTIRMPKGIVSYEKHRWGNYPMHYISSYYDYAYAALNHILTTGTPVPEMLRELYSQKAKLQIETACRQRAEAENEQLSAEIQRLTEENAALSRFGDTLREYDLRREEVRQAAKAFCEEHGLHRAALWGSYPLTPHLIGLLQSVGVTVDYVITDRKREYPVQTVPVKTMPLPQTDAIIICDAETYERRAAKLQTKTSLPLYSISSFLPV